MPTLARPRIDNDQLVLLADAMANELRPWEPQAIVPVGTNGYLIATLLASQLDLPPILPCLDAVVGAGGMRSLGDTPALAAAQVRGKRVLGVADMTVTGTLFDELTMLIAQLGGHPRMAAMTGVGSYPERPGQVIGCRLEVEPDFSWK